MPIDPDDLTRIQRVSEGADDPTVGSGDGFSPKFLIVMFMRLMNLKDYAEQMQDVIQQLQIRIRVLEIKTGTRYTDESEVYLDLTPSGTEFVG